MCLLVTHRVLAGSISRVDDSDATPRLTCCGSFFRFLTSGGLLNFKLVNELVKLVKAVLRLVDDHMVLKHVLVIGDSNHCHRELFTRQRRELA